MLLTLPSHTAAAKSRGSDDVVAFLSSISSCSSDINASFAAFLCVSRVPLSEVVSFELSIVKRESRFSTSYYSAEMTVLSACNIGKLA